MTSEKIKRINEALIGSRLDEDSVVETIEGILGSAYSVSFTGTTKDKDEYRSEFEVFKRGWRTPSTIAVFSNDEEEIRYIM